MKRLKGILSVFICVVIIVSVVTFAYAENELVAPEWASTESFSDEDGTKHTYLHIETPENLTYTIDCYYIKCGDGTNLIIEDSRGGSILFNKTTSAVIYYSVDGVFSEQYKTDITVGTQYEFSDCVTGVKAYVDEGAVENDTFAVSSSYISDGSVYKTVKKQLGTFGRFLIFNINTIQNGEIFDSKSVIKWCLPVPDEFNSEYLYVYKTETDGSLKTVDFEYKDGYAVFNTDETGIFTLYVDEKVHTGDVNNDGRITVIDARLILRSIAKLEVLDEKSEENADIDLNKKINIKDARLLLRYIAGIELLDYIENNKT